MFHQQVKAEKIRRGIHDEDQLLNQKMPMIYTSIAEGKFSELTDKIAKNDTAFKEFFGGEITLQKVESLYTDNSIVNLARRTLVENNNDPKFEPLVAKQDGPASGVPRV